MSLLKPAWVSFPRVISQSHCRKLSFQRLGLMGVGRAFSDYTEKKKGEGDSVCYMCLVEFICSCNRRNKLSFTVLTACLSQYNAYLPDFFSDRLFLFILMSGVQGGSGSTSPRVRGECDRAIGRREVGSETRTAAQSHPADFALKCPRCRSSGQVGRRPLEGCPRRSGHRCTRKPDRTQEEPVVAVLEPRDCPPPHTTTPPPYPPSCIEHTLLEYTLPWHFFWFFPLNGPLHPS